MTSQDIARRLHGLCLLADRYRRPGPRRTAETCMAEFEEIRDGARRLYRELTGSWPRHDGEGEPPPMRRPKPPLPSAMIRDRERRRAGVTRG